MIKMKKVTFFAVFAAAVSLIAVMSSCKGSTGGAPTLIWWNIGTSQPGFAEDLKVISNYTQEKIGVRIDIKQSGWGEASQRWTTMINAGEYFDILFVDEGSYVRFAVMGAFADLTDLLPETVPQLWDYIPDVLWEGVKVKGRIYSVPTYKDSSRTGYYYWDHKYVEKYNIDLTRYGWAYLDEVFRRVKAGEKNPRFYPFQLMRGSDTFLFENYDGLSALMPAIGVRIDDQKRRVVNTLEQPDIKETLAFFHAWYRDGIINPDANMADENPLGVPFFIAQAWPSVAISYAIYNGVEQYDPVRFSGPFYSTGSIQGSLNAISANSKYKKEALRFLQLVNSDTKLRDMLHLGIEGKHFEYVNDGAAIRRIRTDWPLINYQQGSYFIETPLDSAPPGYWDEVRQQNEEATPSVMLGFMMDTDPVINELMNCRNVYNRYAVDLITGASDPGVVLPKVIAELKNNGFDKVIAEAQRQVDEYFDGALQ